MTNEYRIVGDLVYIKLTSRQQPPQEVVIPLDCLELAHGISGDWYLYKHQRTGKYYARGNDKSSGKLKQPLLHRLIMQPAKGQNTQHVDGNTLNCLRENMVNAAIGKDVATALMEAKDDAAVNEALSALHVEHKPPTDDQVPLKGVSLHKVKLRWEVSPFYEGKRYRLGYWDRDDLAGANAAVTLFRELGPLEYFKRYPKDANGVS